MKRIISAILILLMMIPTAFATADTTPAITIETESVNLPRVGDTATIVVRAKSTVDCSSFRIFLTYDDTVLECVETTSLDAKGMMEFNTTARYEGAAKVGVACANSSACFQGDTDLFSVTFKLIAQTQEGKTVVAAPFYEFFDTQKRPQKIESVAFDLGEIFTKHAVPGLTGKTTAEATELLNGLGFQISVKTADFNPNYPAETVISQSVAAGTMLPIDSTVEVTVNGVPETVTVPSLEKLTPAEAEARLNALKLKISYAPAAPYDIDFELGAICRQDVTAGTAVLQGTTVTVAVNGQPQTVAVPDLTGKTQAEAEALLKEAQFKALFQYAPFNAAYPEDTVIAQNKTGTLLQGSAVLATVNCTTPVFSVEVSGGEISRLGDTVTLKIRTKNAPKCASFRIFLAYDDTVLECVNAELLDAKGMFEYDTEKPFEEMTKVGMVCANASRSFEGDTDLCSVTFKVLSAPNENTPLFAVPLYEFVDMNDRFLNPVAFTFGKITLSTAVVPDLVGKTKAEAEALLAAQQLLVDYAPAEPFRLEIAPNTVLYQNQNPGTYMAKGSTVTLTLSGEPQNVSMPNLLGKTKAEAEALLASSLFRVAYGPEAPFQLGVTPGTVVSQSVAAGTSTLQGTTNTLVLAGAPKTVSVPNVLGKTKAEAEALLAAQQLLVDYAPAEPFRLEIAPNTVLYQNQTPGTSMTKGSTVTLTLSGEPQNVSMPNLVGKANAEAEALLASSLFRVAYGPEAPFQLGVTPGTVVSQSVAAGTSALQGTTNTLVLADAPKTVSVPNVLGKTKAEAEALLAAQQFKYAYKDGEYNPAYAENTVIAQSDTTLLQGTVVTLTMNGKKPIVNPFKDVKSNQYYHEAVLWAVEKGITTGMTKTEFKPNETCTRGQIVTFLWRAAGSPEPTASNNPFKDVKSSQYYYKAVLWAVEKGITTGMSATQFKPNAECTREQIVTFLWRANNKAASTLTSNPFKDVKKGQYYYDAVLWAVENGITTGMTATTFGPKSECTRGQIVTFLFRAEQ